MNELKALPCPFCGGEAETIMGPVPCKWGVRCINCDVWRDDRCDTKTEAIASWNRRAPVESALEVTAINRGQSIALLSDGQTIPITTWLDADGECGAGTATTCVCGPDASGRWYAVDLAGFDDAVTQ